MAITFSGPTVRSLVLRIDPDTELLGLTDTYEAPSSAGTFTTTFNADGLASDTDFVAYLATDSSTWKDQLVDDGYTPQS